MTQRSLLRLWAPLASGVSVQQEAAPRTVDTRYLLICAVRRAPHRCPHLQRRSCVAMPSEAVLYTTIAAVHRHRRPVVDALTDPGEFVAPAAVEATRRIQPPCLWQPISSGAWAQVHICVELDRHTSEARFRIVVWILESGVVVLNDVLGAAGCRWWRSACDDSALRRLAGVDAHTYGFQFRSRAKAVECSRIVDHILNVPGVLQVVKKLLRANVDLQSLVMAWQGFGLHSIHYPSRPPRIYSETTPASPSSSCSEPRSDRRTMYPKELHVDVSLLQPGEQQQSRADEEASQIATTGSTVSPKEAVSSGPENDPSIVAQEGTDNQVDELSREMPTSPVALLETGGAMNTNSWFPSLKKRSRKERISRPYKIRGEIHVTYNAEHARYEGLPDAWRTLNQQFGLPLEDVAKREVDGYETKLPAVLEMMKICFLAHGGARTEGVFRLAPDKTAYTAVKTAINNGSFEDCSDVHIVASLLKVWFRELPVSLFNLLSENTIALTCQLVDPEPKEVLRALTTLPSLHQNVVLWLLDLMNEVVKYERHNKMTAKSMAIVMAPNLLHVKSSDAAVVVATYRQVAEFVQLLLHARMEQTSFVG